MGVRMSCTFLCDVVTLQEFPGLAGFPSPPSFK